MNFAAGGSVLRLVAVMPIHNATYVCITANPSLSENVDLISHGVCVCVRARECIYIYIYTYIYIYIQNKNVKYTQGNSYVNVKTQLHTYCK